MDAGDLFVERITEPTVGLPLLGVGGYRPIQDRSTRIEIRYDGQPAAITIPTPVDKENRLHFSTQLPIEENVRQVSVIAVNGAIEQVLFEGDLATIGERGATATVERGVKARLLGTVRRGVRSIATGEVMSMPRWLARLDRFSETLLRVRQKVRNKLLSRRYRPRSLHDGYVERTALSDEQLRDQSESASRLPHQPVISILMPVFNVEPRWFRAAVDSVLTQTYPHWELCIADDASTRVDLLAAFDRLPDDPRIKFVRRTTNGHICAASNSAADLATGDYIALLDHDDRLAANALYEVARTLNREPTADLIYSDEDKIDARSHRYDPQHKPGWSPELLLSYNYINHFTVIRRSLFERVGRFRIGYEGSQDHDLLLRVTERTDRVVHIPKILYHWRSLPTSTASAAGVKGYVHTSGRRAVADALARRGIDANLTVPDFAQKLNLPVLALDSPDDGPSVAIIIHGPADEASRTLERIYESTAYRNFTCYAVPESDAATLNATAAMHSEEYVLVLKAGLIPTDDRWLSRMLAYSCIPGVGAVTGRIAKPDADVSYYFYDEVARNVAAPNAGILLTSRSAFNRHGGFDGHRFNESLFERDFVARLADSGLRCVYAGDAVFQTSRTISNGVDPRELLAFRRDHGECNRYSNPHFATPNSFNLSGDSGLIPAAPAKPLRTVIAAHNLNNPEGAPRYLSEIVHGLRQRGAIDATVLSPLDGAGAAVYRDADVPVRIFEADWSKRFIDAQWSPRSYEAAQNAILGVLREAKPEIIVANTLLTFPVVEAAARLGIPSVWIIHESYSTNVLARLFTPFARHRCEAAFALATRVIPASHNTAALFSHCDVRSNIRVIHNAIDPADIDRYCTRTSREKARSELGLDPSKTHILAVGTVCERKGQHTLVEAASILARKRREFAIHLVGMRDAVPYAGYVRQLVERRDVNDCVNLVGETSNVFAWYRAADLFACTSHMETFSRAILEAEIFGLPIVSTPCHGVGEQVVWNQNALEFPFSDAAVLAERLESLLADPVRRRTMGLKSRAVFDSHPSFDDMLDRYLAVIQQAAGLGAEDRVAEPTHTLRAAA